MKDVLDKHTFPNRKRLQRDMAFLQYMAQKIYVTLCLLGEAAETSLPLRFLEQEGHQYPHRIAIYKPRELLISDRLEFVGFVSSKRKPEDVQVVAEIQATDKKLDEELIRTPGLLSYSSLEFSSGLWCNLVLFNEASTKTQVKHSAVHAYAAYQLAPRYYDWVNIHTGIMPKGLASNELVVQKTKDYLFHTTQKKPMIREVIYMEESR